MEQTDRQAGERYPLRRPKSGRVLLGVCQGIADHLSVPVRTVRLVMALSVFLFGCGIFLYLWLFITVAPSDARPESVKLAPPARKELTGRQRLVVYAGVAVIAAIVVVLIGAANLSWAVVLGVGCIGAGAGLAWSNLSAELTTNQALARLGGGVALLVIGVLVVLMRNQPVGSVASSVVLGTGILAAAGFALWPVIQRLVRDLRQAEEESARESERAEMAAHLHDSVLQTLTLIRNQADDPEAVGRLARVQERQLRSWLYGANRSRAFTLAEAIEDAAAQIEDLYGEAIEVVVVGEGAQATVADGNGAGGNGGSGNGASANGASGKSGGLDRARMDLLLAAAREALANAVRHGAAPVSLYAEVTKERAEIYVRDHGPGFDPAQIPADRHGVRDSIMGRMQYLGGTATFKQRDPGTEVQLRLPLRA